MQKRAEEMYKKAWCTCKVVVLLMKPIVFLTISLPSASLDLEVPILTATQTLKSEPIGNGIHRAPVAMHSVLLMDI